MRTLSRRDFTRLIALSGPATLLGRPGEAAAESGSLPAILPPTPTHPDERFWADVRAQFLLPDDMAFLNAANLCPTSRPVVESLERWTRTLESDPSPVTRGKLPDAREETRTLMADFLGVSAEEIVLTRNTSEGNNLVSSGLWLGPDDEVVVFEDNHPSALRAWQVKAERFGFGVVVVPQVNPHPGRDYYIDAFTKALTTRTRVLAFSHVTNTAGDLLPAADLCRVARERGVLTLVDGAQTFGVLAVRPAELGADFYTGSVHKWLCGPKETGVLYVRREVQDELMPSVVSLYAGRVGASRRLEGMGQRDEPALAAVGDAVRFQAGIGRLEIEARARALAQALMEALGGIDGITLWTHPAPERSAAVITLRPGTLDPQRLAAALYENDGVVCAARGGADRPGIRLSPHLYNLAGEVDRTAAAIQRYLRTGV
ncbi:MAG: aminotransferase class V-fold PLP-dependent enzyme [Gemmatimonadota bacterium]|nr:aminotransferase class V-fold PLP-dependent enzyme [Gemmatimonadota bacterium]